MSINERDEVVNSVKNTAICEWCKKEFTPKQIKKGLMPRFCCIKCNQSSCNEAMRLKNQEEFLKEHGDDPLMPVCKECGWKAFDLITHITKFHKIPLKEYRAKWNVKTSDISHPDHTQMKRERVEGEKNPGYQHNGTMSSVSKRFKKYDGLSEEEKQNKINEVKQKQATSRDNGGGYTNRIDYWLKKGHTKEEAVNMVKHRQSTFSREKCIEQYGPDQGIRVWRERQELWQDTLNNRSIEQQQDLLDKRLSNCGKGWSRIATKFFDDLNCVDAMYASENGTVEFCPVDSNGVAITKSVDFFYNNKIIEFHGDVVHANPKKYKATDHVSFFTNTCVAQHIWDKDSIKVKLLEENGYEVMIVWEDDVKWFRNETIATCRAFLGLTTEDNKETGIEYD